LQNRFGKKRKFLYLPPSPGSGPFGLLAHPSAGLLSLLSPPLPQARAHLSLGPAQLGDRSRSSGHVDARALLPSGSLTRGPLQGRPQPSPGESGQTPSSSRCLAPEPLGFVSSARAPLRSI
jgi:hypothetical protein